MSSIDTVKLLEISGDPIGYGLDPSKCPSDWIGLKQELYDLLCLKNGFYAFESALHVRAKGSEGPPVSLECWNKKELWIDTYEVNKSEVFFFAEDLFGGQFGIFENKIVTFDPETAELEEIGSSLEEWSKQLLSDYNYLTGYSLSHEWQQKYGGIPEGYRLIPRQLFVLGGAYDCENLLLVEEVKGMRSRGFFATQLAEIKDGEEIRFQFVD